MKRLKARRGRHSTNLLTTLSGDLKKLNMQLVNSGDLATLRERAACRDVWRALCVQGD